MIQSDVKGWDFIKDFQTEDGNFFLYDKGIGFKSPMPNKNTEYFSFAEGDKSLKTIQDRSTFINDSYIGIKKDFIDYKVIHIHEKGYSFCFYMPKM
jgi:hypothetical protein